MSGQQFTEVSLSDYIKANNYVIKPNRLVTIKPEPGISITLKNCSVFDHEFIDRSVGEVVVINGAVMGYDSNNKRHTDLVIGSTILIPISNLKEDTDDAIN